MKLLRALILLVALVVVLTWVAAAAARAPAGMTVSQRVLVMELRMDELGRQHQLLIGLLIADFLGTLALLKRGRD